MGSRVGEGIVNGMGTWTTDGNGNQQSQSVDNSPDDITFYPDSFDDRQCHPGSPNNPKTVPCPDTSSGEYVMFFPIPPDFNFCHPVHPFNPDVVPCPR